MKVGQKVFLVHLDQAGLYCTVPGKVKRLGDGDHVFVEVLSPDGDKMVLDRLAADVHARERDALGQAVKRCRKVARRYTDRADELADWLGRTK